MRAILGLVLASTVGLCAASPPPARADGGAGVEARLQARVTALVEDLADDDTPGNATVAAGELLRLPRPVVIPALERATRSADPQQRRLARDILDVARGDAEADTLLSVDRLVAMLADDEAAGNAIRAYHLLRWVGEPAVAALEKAIAADDPQQRLLAQMTLMRIEGYQPSAALLSAAVRSLALPPEGPDRDARRSIFFPAENPTEMTVAYLLLHAAAAEDALAAAAAEPADHQQRFLAAFILGHSALGETDVLAPILIEHLRDNNIRQDAVMAASALYNLGEAARDHLERAVNNPADDQQRKLLELVLFDLNDPPLTDDDLADRRGMVPFASLYKDPAVQYRFDHAGLVWGEQMPAPRPVDAETEP